MCEQVYKGGGDDDAGSKLLQDNEDDVGVGHQVEASGENGCKHTDGAGDENDEKKSDTQRNVIVPLCDLTVPFS